MATFELVSNENENAVIKITDEVVVTKSESDLITRKAALQAKIAEIDALLVEISKLK